MRLKGQRGGEDVDVVAVRARAEARVEHVVAAGHALDDVAGEPGVDAVRGDVDRLAWLQDEIVHREQRDERAVVRVGVLFLQTWEEFRDVALLTEGFFGQLCQAGLGFARDILGREQECVAELAEGLVVQVRVLVWEEALQRLQLEEVADVREVLEAGEGLEF